MLDAKIIRPSTSRYASPVVLVTKSDQTKRFCCDYWLLNKITKTDSYKLPRIDDTLDILGTSNPILFSSLDCRSGYWQVEKEEVSKDKMAFITHAGLY